MASSKPRRGKHSVSVTAKTFEKLATRRAETGETIRSLVEQALGYHTHAWDPVPMHMGRYMCSAGSSPCGAIGYRHVLGMIVPHKVKVKIPERLTAYAKRETSGRVGISPPPDFEPPKESE